MGDIDSLARSLIGILPRNRCTSGLSEGCGGSPCDRRIEFVNSFTRHFAHSVGLVTDTRYQGSRAARTVPRRGPVASRQSVPRTAWCSATTPNVMLRQTTSVQPDRAIILANDG